MNRRGFTLIELITTISIIGVLASIAIPKYQALRKRATGAEVVAAMTTVRAGAYQYNETVGAWPPSAAMGTVPTGLGQYLPGDGGGLFSNPQYQLGWIALNIQGVGSNTTQLLYSYTGDGVICQAVFGLWGGTSNPDLLSLCAATGGFVFLWVDR